MEIAAANSRRFIFMRCLQIERPGGSFPDLHIMQRRSRVAVA
jgi:hypothetical protein